MPLSLPRQMPIHQEIALPPLRTNAFLRLKISRAQTVGGLHESALPGYEIRVEKDEFS